MFLRLIYLKNSTFPSVKTTVDTLIDVRNEISKHHLAHFIGGNFQKALIINILLRLRMSTYAYALVKTSLKELRM